MNTNHLPRLAAGRATLGTALVLALSAMLASSAHAQNLTVSATGAVVNEGVVQYTDFNPVLATFNFSSDTAALTTLANAGGIGNVGAQLTLNGFDTTTTLQDYNNIELVLSGTVTGGTGLLGGANGTVETLDTGVLINGFQDTTVTKNLSISTLTAADNFTSTYGFTASTPIATLLTGYTAGSQLPVDGSGVLIPGSLTFDPTGLSVSQSILDLLNDTGGYITASILELTPENDNNPVFEGDPAGENEFTVLSGNMTLAFSVPFSPMQWLGLAVIALLAALRLSTTGGLQKIRVLAGV